MGKRESARGIAIWSIRNRLGIGEISLSFLWALLVAAGTGRKEKRRKQA